MRGITVRTKKGAGRYRGQEGGGGAGSGGVGLT